MRIRQELAVSGDEFREIISQKSVKNTWGELTGDELKSAPRAFDKDHPDIDLIRKKQFLFMIHFNNSEVENSGFSERISSAVQDIRPFVDFMSDVLTTDSNGESLI